MVSCIGKESCFLVLTNNDDDNNDNDGNDDEDDDDNDDDNIPQVRRNRQNADNNNSNNTDADANDIVGRQDSLKTVFFGRAIEDFCPWRGPLFGAIFWGLVWKITLSTIHRYDPKFS